LVYLRLFGFISVDMDTKMVIRDMEVRIKRWVYEWKREVLADFG